MKSKIEKIGIKSLIKETFKEEKVPSTGLIISTDISL
jgi:hypothetical protein